MIEDHIQDGDYVVIRKTETARDGDGVAAMINDEVTLKRFYKAPDHIRLEPANKDMAPIIVKSTEEAAPSSTRRRCQALTQGTPGTRAAAVYRK